jgi:hypothetical protein
MRSDMFKVIINRPRWGSRWIPSAKLKKDRTDRTSLSLKRHAREGAPYTKSLNENLAPLIRFIQKRVGQRWDDVFSEICKHLDTGSTVKMHVREHLGDFVALVSYGRHGELLDRGYVIRPDRRSSANQFYVDPDDGILKDRVRFWGCRGITVPASRRDLKWDWEQ